MVDSEHHRPVHAFTLARCGYQHSLRSGRDVRLHALASPEQPCALHHHVHVQRAPVAERRVAVAGHTHGSRAKIHRVAMKHDRMCEPPVYAVIAEKMCGSFRLARTVDRHDADVLHAVFHHRARHQPPDAPEPVDAHSDRHAARLGQP